jgi:hypothetical protein
MGEKEGGSLKSANDDKSLGRHSGAEVSEG